MGVVLEDHEHRTAEQMTVKERVASLEQQLEWMLDKFNREVGEIKFRGWTIEQSTGSRLYNVQLTLLK